MAAGVWASARLSLAWNLDQTGLAFLEEVFRRDGHGE